MKKRIRAFFREFAFRVSGAWRALRGRGFRGAHSFFDAAMPSSTPRNGEKRGQNDFQAELLVTDGNKVGFAHIGYFPTLDAARQCRVGVIRIRRGKAVWIQISLSTAYMER